MQTGIIMRRYYCFALLAALLTPVRSYAQEATPTREIPMGLSGALRIQLALPGEIINLPLKVRLDREPRFYRWVASEGTHSQADARPLPQDWIVPAPSDAGTYRLSLGPDKESLEETERYYLIVQVPFSAKVQGQIKGYRIGRYPTEDTERRGRYAPPEGFIEVNPTNQNLLVSQNFRIRQFLTKDQHNVWPKYLVLEPKLLDKLELTRQELQHRGIRLGRIHVMSGFRTPQYNQSGNTGGRSKMSRHQYGDAADIWVEISEEEFQRERCSDSQDREIISHFARTGKYGDGSCFYAPHWKESRNDKRFLNIQLIAEAAERVEIAHKELVGGIGLYEANSAHPRFVHIDVRGTKARW